MSTDLDARAFDHQDAWALNSQVALREERFGALAYHFGTRRLSFLKAPVLVEIVRTLADHDTAAQAISAAGVSGRQLASITSALARLSDTDMIVRRSA